MRSTSGKDLGRLLRQALQASLLRRPSGIAAPLSAGPFVVVAITALLIGFGIDYARIDGPRMFNPWALSIRSFPLLLALIAGLLGAALIRRPALALRLAALALLATLPLQALLAFWPAHWPRPFEPMLLLALVGYLIAIMGRLFGWAADRRPFWRPLSATVLAATVLFASLLLVPRAAWWWPATPFDGSDEELAGRDYSAEALLYAQPALLQTALERLQPQRPGQIDLYAIGFAGDGMESVFRNEVEHFERLVSQRFDSPARTLTLINHPDTLEQAPLATLSNLRLALDGLAQRMDVEEDLLLLFLTSHGSAEHELHVALDDLPLDAIAPEDLADALDGAGIRWRVLIVSACYSGGFIEPLANPQTLIITAARADRTSFGCGANSEITWFGQALLAEALNATTDFGEAFEHARTAIRRREREQEERPSYPQMRLGEAIAPRLAEWRQSLRPGPEVAFVPAVPGASSDAAAEDAATDTTEDVTEDTTQAPAEAAEVAPPSAEAADAREIEPAPAPARHPGASRDPS